MFTNRSELFRNPTKALVWIHLLASVVSTFCILFAATDGFEASPLQKENLLFGFLLFTSAASTIMVVRNYFRKKAA